MAKYRSKPVVIDAFQFHPATITNGQAAANGICYGPMSGEGCIVSNEAHVHTMHEGQHVLLSDGDFVVPEPDGVHFYPVKESVFLNKYEPVQEGAEYVGMTENGEKFSVEEEREESNKRQEGFAREW